MKRKPKLTKRERKAAAPARPAQQAAPKGHSHIHCIACGKHLNPEEFEAPATATTITCDHGTQFATCVRCAVKSKSLVQEHDASNKPVRAATAWH